MSFLYSALVYTLCWMISYFLAQRRYLAVKNRIVCKSGVAVQGHCTPLKMPILLIVVIALIFTYYCHFSLAPYDMMAGDRQNYQVNFTGDRESPSIGLTFILTVIHYYGGDFYTLLYLSTFVSMLVTLLAYRHSKDATPEALLLLFLSQYVLTTLTALKQCYASAFATLAIVLILQERSKMKEIAIYSLMLLAILFHPTGYILVPLYILLRYYEKKKKDMSQFVLPLILFAILFIPVMQVFINLLSSVLPGLSGKIDEYFGEGSDGSDDRGIVVILKGIPYYVIAWTALSNRNLLRRKIPFFNGYMIIVLLGSFLYMMNLYNVWMSRFMFLFQLPIYIFFFMMVRYIKNGKRVALFVYMMTFITTYRFLYIVGGYF